MILYFADRHMNVLGQASTELPKGLYISDDLKTEEVEAGVATLEFTLNYTASTRNDANSMVLLAIIFFGRMAMSRNFIRSLPAKKIFSNRK